MKTLTNAEKGELRKAVDQRLTRLRILVQREAACGEPNEVAAREEAKAVLMAAARKVGVWP